MKSNENQKINFSLHSKGKLIDLTTPKVMGILNATPDSFYDGGKYNLLDSALLRIEKMLHDGASFIDIGGQTTKPGAIDIGAENELKKILPIVEKSIEKFPDVILSIDTFHAKVANECINAGGSIVNDISGGNFDEKMFETVSKLECPYILMHIQGTPKNMQKNPTYTNVALDIIKELSAKIEKLKNLNVKDIIIDPGFGFGKTNEHNFKILKDLKMFERVLKLPILTGLSRKSMIWKTLNSSPNEALNGTTALNMLALNNGAKILRVHDVKEAKECIQLFNQLP